MLAETAAPVSQGLTLGLGDILRAHRILLMVSGAAKRAPLAQLAARRVTPALPASFLWLHGDADLPLRPGIRGQHRTRDDAEP